MHGATYLVGLLHLADSLSSLVFLVSLLLPVSPYMSCCLNWNLCLYLYSSAGRLGLALADNSKVSSLSQTCHSLSHPVCLSCQSSSIFFPKVPKCLVLLPHTDGEKSNKVNLSQPVPPSLSLSSQNSTIFFLKVVMIHCTNLCIYFG